MPGSSSMDPSRNTPWCEKYRPTNIESIVLEPINRTIFDNILEHNYFPNLLFYGPPGVGKTTTADNLILNYQKRYSKINRETIIHLNASDERGIEVIRTQIYNFVKSKNMFEKGLKFVILDEVDYMTKNAQQALKNLLQSCIDNVRFIMICNYICKIDESLKNEFTCVRFNQLPQPEIVKLIRTIADAEDLHITDEAIVTIQQMFYSDIRSMINYIQLNQNNTEFEYLFHDTLCKELHNILHTNAQADALTWLYTQSNKCGVNFRSILTKYYLYVFTHDRAKITKEFLNVIEVIVHNANQEHTMEYFVTQVQSLFAR